MLIILAGIYYGAMYGGSTTAILVNLRLGEREAEIKAWFGYDFERMTSFE